MVQGLYHAGQLCCTVDSGSSRIEDMQEISHELRKLSAQYGVRKHTHSMEGCFKTLRNALSSGRMRP